MNKENRVRVFGMPPALNSGFKDLKDRTGTNLNAIYLVALHMGLMKLKKLNHIPEIPKEYETE